MRIKYDFKIFSKRKKIVWIGSKTQRIRDEKIIRFGVEYFCYFRPHPFSFCVNPYFPIYFFRLICIMFIQVASCSPYVAQIHTFDFVFSLILSTFELAVSFNIFDYNIFDYRQYVNVIACCQNNFVTLISMYVVWYLNFYVYLVNLFQSLFSSMKHNLEGKNILLYFDMYIIYISTYGKVW